MRFQNLMVVAAMSCLFLGVSGRAAMAEGCGDGVLLGERFDTLRVTDEDSCTIIGSTIDGDLRIINVRNVVLINNTVNGLIRVDGRDREAGSVANVIENTVVGGKLVVREYEIANVIGNETLNQFEGDIRVILNIRAFVQQSLAARDLICRRNTALDASFNVAVGNEDCE